MADTITSYPLTWPEGWKRASNRIKSKFGEHTIDHGVNKIIHELKLMRVHHQDIIISTSLKLRLDGLPYSSQPQPKDPGVSVWWITDESEQKVFPLDKYQKIEDNLYAIAMSLEAMRGIDRWSGGEILDRAFTGFVALPAPTGKSWREVLGYNGVDLFEASKFYKRARSAAHTDKGGTDEQFIAVNKAWAECQKELQT